MLSQEYAAQAVELHRFEEDMKKGVLMLGRICWQQSTPYIRSKYPRFALSPEKFKEIRLLYQTQVEKGKAFAVTTVARVLNAVISINHIWDDRLLGDSRRMGKLLQLISYASCHFGFEASFGDVENHLRFIGPKVIYQTHDSDQLFLLRTFQTWNLSYARIFFTWHFERSIEEMKSLGIRFPHEDACCHGPPFSFLEDGKHDLCRDRIATKYYLFFSLLRFVEPITGTA